MRTLEKEYHADRSMICKWVKKYIAEGESSFVHMKCCDNYQEEIEKHHFPKMIEDESWTYEEISEINRRIHKRLTKSPSIDADGHKRSTHQRFYVSSTTFNTDGYSPESMTPTLQKFGFDVENYKKHGLFVIRSTIMNPWYYRVQHSHSQVDYFSLFIEELHSAARQTIDEMTAGKRKKQTT